MYNQFFLKKNVKKLCLKVKNYIDYKMNSSIKLDCKFTIIIISAIGYRRHEGDVLVILLKHSTSLDS